MKNIIYAIKKSKKNIVTFIILSFGFAGLYYFALIQSAPFEVFIKSNSPTFVTLQIIFSILNSLVGAVSVLLLIELFRIQKKVGGTNGLQSIVALFISVATTGCYVCGSILLPGLGLAASFTAMPFGGLEVKILTLLLLIYSVRDLNKKLLGTCKIYQDRFIVLKVNEDKRFRFNLKRLLELQPTFITFSFIILIFALPSILPSVTTASINDPNQYICVDH